MVYDRPNGRFMNGIGRKTKIKGLMNGIGRKIKIKRFMNGIGRKNKIKGNTIVGNKSGDKIFMNRIGCKTKIKGNPIVGNKNFIVKNSFNVKSCLEGTAVTNSSPMSGKKYFVVVVVAVFFAVLYFRDHFIVQLGMRNLPLVGMLGCLNFHPRPQQREQKHRKDQKGHKHRKSLRWQGPESDGHKPGQKIDRDGKPYFQCYRASNEIECVDSAEGPESDGDKPGQKIDRDGKTYVLCCRALNETEDVDSDEESGGF